MGISADFAFGDDFRVNIGGYTGPILFEMGDKGADPSGPLSAETILILAEASSGTVQRAEIQIGTMRHLKRSDA